MVDFSIGERELDVMGVLWELGSGTVAEVRARVPAELAYTTVLTILRNLEAKRFVRREAEGRGHRYFPAIPRELASQNAVRRVIDKLFRGSPELLLTHLVDEQTMSDEELKRLRRRLKARLREQRGES